MDNSPRKASDIILSLEHKVEQLVKSNNALDLSVKVLSNRLNKVLDILQNVNIAANPAIPSMLPNVQNQAPITNLYSASAPPTPALPPEGFGDFQEEQTESVMVKKEEMLPITDEASGFRRTSRPDGNNMVKANSIPVINAPTMTQVEVPQTAVADGSPKIAVQQRVVDKNNKAVYLANVEITNLDSHRLVYKGRTTGVGKWAAPLPAGNYQVVIKRLEPGTNQKLEGIQKLTVDGSSPQLNLPTAII